MIYGSREGKANERTNGIIVVLRSEEDGNLVKKKRKKNERTEAGKRPLCIYDAWTKRNEGSEDDGKSCRDWHVWNASAGLYRDPHALTPILMHACSKTSKREGCQLTRVEHTLKRCRNILRILRPMSTVAYINYSPILTEIDLTSNEFKGWKKKKRQLVKTSSGFPQADVVSISRIGPSCI